MLASRLHVYPCMKIMTVLPRSEPAIPVACNECGRKFTTRSMLLPTCPKCGGSDVEPQ